MPDWAIVLTGLFGVIIGALITFLIHWWERKERYQVITFDKRLEVHQQAFYWCSKSYLGFKRVTRRELKSPSNLLTTAKEAMEWWQNNCLYLDEDSRISMLQAILAILQRTDKIISKGEQVTSEDDEVRTQIMKALNCIITGIGAKYLPELQKQLELSE